VNGVKAPRGYARVGRKAGVQCGVGDRRGVATDFVFALRSFRHSGGYAWCDAAYYDLCGAFRRQ
jgi:hypothetical protein